MSNQQSLKASDDHHGRIKFAVKKSFPHKSWDIIKLLHGGLSGACTYLVNIDDKSYAVKLEKLNVKEMNLERYCEVIKIASDESCCPKVHFTDAAQGVILMDYVDSKPPPSAMFNAIEVLARDN